jgi:hypothetical protein
MDKQVTYALKLSGEGLNLERNIDPEVAHTIIRLVFGGGTSAPLIAPTPAPVQSIGALPTVAAPAAAGSPPLSVREFLEAHNAKRIPEQIATIALFLKQHQNAPAFTSKDLVKGFENAQEPAPKNLPRDIAWTTKIGWIAPKSGEKKTFYLTGTGESAVKAKFPEDVKKRTKLPRAARKSGGGEKVAS